MGKAFLFDMDGVIINSEPMHEQVDIEVAAGYKIALNQQRLQKYVGMRNQDLWTSIIEEEQFSLSAEDIILEVNEKKVRYIEENDFQPIPGIRELLEKLKSVNYRIALASSSPKDFIDAVLKKFEINAYFEVIVNGDEVEEGKPAPDIYLEAARRLNVNPKNCIVLEDSKNGVDSGNRAGMKTIGYVNPDSGNQDLSRATHLVHSIVEVLKYI